MNNKTEVKQDRVTVTMTREQYSDLMDSLDALACHLDDLTNLEAVVNCFRDQNCLYLPLGEVLRELKDTSPAKTLWYNQAKHKHQDLTSLITRVRTLCGDRHGRQANSEKGKGKSAASSCAA